MLLSRPENKKRMPAIKTADDLLQIDDPLIEDFMKKYAHFLVPRSAPIEIERDGGTIKIGEHLTWENGEFHIRGKILGEEVDKKIDENLAKLLLLDAGDAEELVYAAAALGGKPTHITRAKAYILFDRIILLFTIISGMYHFLDIDGVRSVNTINDIKEILENARNYLHEGYDRIVYGQSSVIYVKDSGDYRVLVRYSEKQCSLTVMRSDEYPPYMSGEIVFTTNFSPEFFDVVLNMIAPNNTPYDIIKNAIILNM